MTNHEPKYRRPLSPQQLDILELLYKFRFGSCDLVAEYFGKSHRMFAFNRLKILEEQGFIAKRFHNSYRLAGKPAAYYLLPTGARALLHSEEISMSAIYKNKTASDQFIAHSLDLFKIYNQLRARYPEIKCFTKSNLNQEKYAYFPKPLPDAFLSIKKDGNTPKCFFFELLETTTPIFAHKRRIKQYIEYAEADDWSVTKSELPIVLLACETELLQQKMQKQIIKLLQDAEENISFYLATQKRLENLNENGAVWQSTDDFDEVLSLEDI